jgi:hypothetical protein
MQGIGFECRGASGGGTKGPSIVDKRKQEYPCPYCDRVFQQKDRYTAHVSSKHAAEAEAAAAEAASTSSGAADPENGNDSKGGMMKSGSKAGYYTCKAPSLLLQEHLKASQQQRARVKAMVWKRFRALSNAFIYCASVWCQARQ